jgi:hypothetical protein
MNYLNFVFLHKNQCGTENSSCTMDMESGIFHHEFSGTHCPKNPESPPGRGYAVRRVFRYGIGIV